MTVRRSSLPHPHPAAPAIARAAHEKSPTGVTRYSTCHDCRWTVPPLSLQSLTVTKVACHPDNIAAAMQCFRGWNCECPAARLTPKPGFSTATTITEGETKMPTVTWDHVHLSS